MKWQNNGIFLYLGDKPVGQYGGERGEWESGVLLQWQSHLIPQKSFSRTALKNTFRKFKKKILWFLKIYWHQIFEILIIHKLSLGSRDVPHKIWSRSVQPFLHLLDTNRQRHTDKQSIYIDLKVLVTHIPRVPKTNFACKTYRA